MERMRLPVLTLAVCCTLTACQVVTTATKGGGKTDPPVVGSCAGVSLPAPQPYGQITVLVQDADGKPAKDAEVSVTKAAAYALLCSPAAQPRAGFSGRTDANGKASQDLQAYGSYTVTARLDGQLASGKLVVDADHKAASVTLVLAKAAAPAPALLQAPTEPSTRLAGTVTIDAAYTVAHGSGTLLSDHGSGILAVGGLVSDQGGGLISDHGGALVANNSGNIIANNAGNILSNNSSSLTGKTKRTVLADAAPAPGTTLPAAGMLIRATSMHTHEPIALGVDGAGQPVYAIYSNLNGAFEIFVPASEQGNVLLSAEVPGVDDARLSYLTVAPAKAAEGLPIDEDANATTRYVREGLIGRLVQMMTEEPAESLCLLADNGNLSPTLKQLIATTVTEMHTAALGVGIQPADRTNLAVWALAGRCADAVIAQTDLQALKLGTSNTAWGNQANEGPEPALQAMDEVLGAARAAAAKQLAADPRYFDGFQALKDANACEPGRYQILKPADVSSFLVDEYLSRTGKNAVKDAGNILIALGAGLDAKGVERLRRMRASADAIAQGLSQSFVLDTGGARTQIMALVKAYQPSYQAIPGEPRPFVIQPSCIQRESCVDPAATP
jgi:hypothetical protein